MLEFFDFRGTKFTRLTGQDGKPWWVAKELCDYLERGRDTLIRQVGRLTRKWQFFQSGHR
jgi:prophage antirepressor-like protein